MTVVYSDGERVENIFDTIAVKPKQQFSGAQSFDEAGINWSQEDPNFKNQKEFSLQDLGYTEEEIFKRGREMLKDAHRDQLGIHRVSPFEKFDDNITTMQRIDDIVRGGTIEELKTAEEEFEGNLRDRSKYYDNVGPPQPRKIADERKDLKYEDIPEIENHAEGFKSFHNWRSRNVVPGFKDQKDFEQWVRGQGEVFVTQKELEHVSKLPSDINVDRILLDKKNPHSKWIRLRVSVPTS